MQQALRKNSYGTQSNLKEIVLKSCQRQTSKRVLIKIKNQPNKLKFPNFSAREIDLTDFAKIEKVGKNLSPLSKTNQSRTRIATLEEN